jgi:hypothetical protein
MSLPRPHFSSFRNMRICSNRCSKIGRASSSSAFHRFSTTLGSIAEVNSHDGSAFDVPAVRTLCWLWGGERLAHLRDKLHDEGNRDVVQPSQGLLADRRASARFPIVSRKSRDSVRSRREVPAVPSGALLSLAVTTRRWVGWRQRVVFAKFLCVPHDLQTG